MLWLQSILNAFWYGIKIFTLTSIWVSIEHNYESLLIRSVCRVLNVTSRYGCVLIRYMIHFWTYLLCLTIMIFAYSLIGHVNLVETLRQILRGVEVSQPEKNADKKKLEWMFLITISRHLVRLRVASLHTAGVKTLEFARRFSLIGFMLAGYLCGFWKIMYSACFFVDFIEMMKLLCRVCRAVDVGSGYRRRDLFKTSLTCLGLCWAYIFLYLLPSLFIHNLLYFGSSKEMGVIPLFLFRIHFLAIVILSAINSPFESSYPYVGLDTADEIVNPGQCSPKGPVVTPLLSLNRSELSEKTVRKRVTDAHILNTDLEEKTSTEKMKQRAAVGQIIRCMVTLKRKAKQIRAKKEKLTQSTTKANEPDEEKD